MRVYTDDNVFAVDVETSPGQSFTLSQELILAAKPPTTPDHPMTFIHNERSFIP